MASKFRIAQQREIQFVFLPEFRLGSTLSRAAAQNHRAGVVELRLGVAESRLRWCIRGVALG